MGVLDKRMYVGNGDPATKYQELWNMTSGTIAIDVETVSLDDRRPLGIGFTFEQDGGFYFETWADGIPFHLLKNPNIVKLFHNGAFDLGIIKEEWDIDVVNWYDTMLAANLQNFEEKSLSYLSMQLYGDKLMSIEDLAGKGKNMKPLDTVDPMKLGTKCIQDVEYTLRVWESIKPEIQWELLDLDMELAPVLVNMTNVGMRVDEERMAQHDQKLSRQLSFFKEYAQGQWGMNPGSSKQLAAVFEARGHRVRYKRSTGNPILDEREISTRYMHDPLAHFVLKYREVQKLKSTYINSIRNKHMTNGRIHPSFNQAVARSSRLSSSGPNAQNIPFDMRDMFIPDDGEYFEDWDLSQIELRILAFLCEQEIGDNTMAEIYRQRKDVHANTANGITALGYPMSRYTGKQTNFTIVYMGDEETLTKRFGVPPKLGVKFMESFFQIYPGVKPLIDYSLQCLHFYGYVETLGGRRRYFPDLEYLQRNRGDYYAEKAIKEFEREAFNHRIQGTAAEDMKRLLIRNKDKKMQNTVHDSALFGVKPGEVMDYSSCEHLGPYVTPMEVGRGINWKDCKDEDNGAKLVKYGE